MTEYMVIRFCYTRECLVTNRPSMTRETTTYVSRYMIRNSITTTVSAVTDCCCPLSGLTLHKVHCSKATNKYISVFYSFKNTSVDCLKLVLFSFIVSSRSVTHFIKEVIVVLILLMLLLHCHILIEGLTS